MEKFLLVFFYLSLMKLKTFFEGNFTVNNRGTNTHGSGDYSGKDFHIGGPWGFSNQRQLANPQVWKNLKDPEQAEEDYYNPLDPESTEPSAPPPLNKLDNPSIYSEDGTDDPGRQFYRNLPWTKMDLLAKPMKHIPADQDPMRDFSETDVDGTGKQIEYWPPNEPLNPIDPLEEELNLLKRSNPSINNWKTTTRSNQGYAARSVSMGQLVDPQDFTPLDSEEDVRTGPFSMGKVVAPVRHVPFDKDVKAIKNVVAEAVKEGMKKAKKIK